MRLVRQPTFATVGKDHPAFKDSLIVHMHEDSQELNLVVFVHGLGGRRYKTWGGFPENMFHLCGDIDVGLYDYPSGVRRIMGKSLPLDSHATELADSLRDGKYTNIVLVGHSMGGLLCKAVIKQLMQSRAPDGKSVADRIAGLVLFATPQAGSLRVPPLLGGLTKDSRVLRAHSNYVADLNDFFTNNVESNVTWRGVHRGRAAIPTYAIRGNADVWVDKLSADLGLPREHVKTVRGSHTSIVKLRSAEEQLFGWFLDRVQLCMSTGPANAATPVLRNHAQRGGAGEKLASFLEDEIGRAITGSTTRTKLLRATITIEVEEEYADQAPDAL